MPLDGESMKEKGEKRMCRWKWPVIFILCMGLLILHAQAYVICGPDKVTRGGVALYTPEIGKINPDLDVDIYDETNNSVEAVIHNIMHDVISYCAKNTR